MIWLLFWAAVLLIAYTYLFFPAIVVLRGLLFPREYRCAEIVPSVSLIIVAHNEATSIAAKLDNSLSLDYPRERLEVIVASDGSIDGTDELVEQYAGQGVRLLQLPRAGKIPALNAAVANARGQILAFSDANSIYSPNALRRLVGPFADPQVGGVAGDQRYLSAATGAGAGERLYWDFDRQLKFFQSIAGSCTSATGAIYAIRRSLFRPVASCVTDDFVNSTGVIGQGYRLVFEPQAVAYEPVAKASGVEFGRKVRVITRGLRGLLVRRELLNPLRYGFYSLQLLSHKLLRRLVVFPLLVLLVASPLLWSEGILYQAATVVQAEFYALAALGSLLNHTWLGRWKLFSLPYFFCLVNVACLVATVRTLLGQRIEFWEPQRETPADTVVVADGPAVRAPGNGA